jgi:hypothetical protein
LHHAYEREHYERDIAFELCSGTDIGTAPPLLLIVASVPIGM